MERQSIVKTQESLMGKSIKDQLGRTITKKNGASQTGCGPAPIVILVRPQLGENIGAAARAMLNFGLDELRLVAPRDGWPNPASVALAAGAQEVLDNAKVYPSTQAALKDIEVAMASTARRRELEIPAIGSDEAGGIYKNWQNNGKRSAILFGPEKAGLTNDDIVLCDYILTYPINPAFQSLNLAQAVVVFSHIWAMAQNAGLPDVFQSSSSSPAKKDDLVRMFEHLETELQAAGFFYPAEKTPLMIRNIRAPFTRAQMSAQEVQTFRGLIKALVKGRGRASGRSGRQS